MSEVDLTMFTGNLAADPEGGSGPDATVANLRVAKHRTWKDKSTGEERKANEFVDVEVWGSQAERCLEELQKGHRVLVVGSLRQNNWQEEDGKNRSKLFVRASHVQPTFEFAPGRGEDQ